MRRSELKISDDLHIISTDEKRAASFHHVVPARRSHGRRRASADSCVLEMHARGHVEPVATSRASTRSRTVYPAATGEAEDGLRVYLQRIGVGGRRRARGP